MIKNKKKLILFVFILTLITVTNCGVNEYSPFSLLNEEITFQQAKDAGKKGTGKIDLKLIDTFLLSGSTEPKGMAYDGEYIWVICRDEVIRVSPNGVKTKTILPSIIGMKGITYYDSYLWITADQAKVYKVEPSDGTIVETLTRESFNATAILYYSGGFWLPTELGEMYKLNLLGSTLTSYNLSILPKGIAEKDDKFYMIEYEEFDDLYLLSVLSPGSGSISSSITLPFDHAYGITYDGTYFWISDDQENKLYKLQVTVQD